MAKSLFDDEQFAVRCGNCGRKAKKSLGWLRTHKEMPCPHCGARIGIDTKATERAIEAAERACRNLLDRISKVHR